MKTRCLNPAYHAYARYGGRGIAICAEWRTSFEAFLRDMGLCPPSHSLDRINNDGPYEPGNCRWATQAVQSRNREAATLTEDRVREIRRLRAEGVKRPDIARRLGVSYSAVSDVVLGRRWRDLVS